MKAITRKFNVGKTQFYEVITKGGTKKKNELFNVIDSMKRRLPQLETKTLIKLCGCDPYRVRSRKIPISGILQA
jgi:hypothetical protein